MSDLILSWVLPDPNRERSVDPLGTGAFAERLADQLVPGFSGATTRARYLSLLCTAVRKAARSDAPLRTIHRIEADHAVREAIHHRDEAPQECPDVVGRQRATAELKRFDWERPSRPERLYKSTAFAQYPLADAFARPPPWALISAPVPRRRAARCGVSAAWLR